MLLEKDRSCLFLIDVQEKLTPYVLNSEGVIARCQWLLRLAKRLEVPIQVSEQYPSGLGGTIEPLREFLPQKCLTKVHFSSYQDPHFNEFWQGVDRNQVIIAGIETHVCVMQTALDMQAAGLNVFVVVDAVSSRNELDHRYGLKRMKAHGIELITAEMVFFEWLRKAGSPEFKELSKNFLR
ncbi:YcaC like amidohydrolase (plasmid) [Legionella adelaidensis]|uniref:YcaC like amidohydrolase n=1 Tax=Legionella adelaidensis TaxID=45056 RepID=A0A0W0R434_9GAMM|nr:hydrolase [Legionella adelaidensis]KTC65799.1 YcaC related amidohydrolase [Legionella adelaidensis]VEH85227.1 YcaC like amidohydrolase [Legionella adelaidensis]